MPTPNSNYPAQLKNALFLNAPPHYTRGRSVCNPFKVGHKVYARDYRDGVAREYTIEEVSPEMFAQWHWCKVDNDWYIMDYQIDDVLRSLKPFDDPQVGCPFLIGQRMFGTASVSYLGTVRYVWNHTLSGKWMASTDFDCSVEADDLTRRLVTHGRRHPHTSPRQPQLLSVYEQK